MALLSEKKLKSLTETYYKQMFDPTFLGIFINPSYIVRKALYKGISSNKKYIKGKCLDFGCGRKPYRHLFEVDEYIGLDIEESGHDHKDEQIDVTYDGKTIPFKTNQIDSIFSSEVFEHVFNLDEILEELYRVLKPGGHMLFTVPFVWDEHEIPYDFGRYTSYGVSHLMEKHGFIVVKLTKSTNYIETISQMWITYVRKVIFPSKPRYKLLLTPIFIAPLTCLSLLISKILPKNNNFYHNNIVVVKKPKLTKEK